VATGFRACRSSAEFLEFGIHFGHLDRFEKPVVGVGGEAGARPRGAFQSIVSRREWASVTSSRLQEANLTFEDRSGQFGSRFPLRASCGETFLLHLIEGSHGRSAWPCC